jgi:GNAT superfamily N-acetyltransferase
MTVVCRPACAEDLELADALVVARSESSEFSVVLSSGRPDGPWVAEDEGRILGFAWSWACGDIWFLAQLFVSPDRQGGSIGNELIERTLDHAKKSGASNRVLITFSFNTVSQGLYIRHGLFPRFPIYTVRVPRERLVGRNSNVLRSTKALRPWLAWCRRTSGCLEYPAKAPSLSHQRQPDAWLQPVR